MSPHPPPLFTSLRSPGTPCPTGSPSSCFFHLPPIFLCLVPFGHLVLSSSENSSLVLLCFLHSAHPHLKLCLLYFFPVCPFRMKSPWAQGLGSVSFVIVSLVPKIAPNTQWVVPKYHRKKRLCFPELPVFSWYTQGHRYLAYSGGYGKNPELVGWCWKLSCLQAPYTPACWSLQPPSLVPP